MFIAGKYTLENLENVARGVDAAIFVFSEDDKSWYRDDLISTVRDNVLFEYGLFCGHLTKSNVCFCCIGKPKIASDLSGITYIDIEKRNQAEEDIKQWIESVSVQKLAIQSDYEIIERKSSSTLELMMKNLHLKVDEDIFTPCRVRESRYSRQEEYRNMFLSSSSIKIVDVNPEKLLIDIKDSICDNKELDMIREKTIQILIPGNEHYINMVNRLEEGGGTNPFRPLLSDLFNHATNIVRLKYINNLDGLEIKMHLFSCSCTFMIFDNFMLLSPYIHRAGRTSPTFIITRYENEKAFNDYDEYFNRLWNKSLSVEKDDVPDSIDRLQIKLDGFKEKLVTKKNELGLL